MRILVPTDLSPYSDRALRLAESIAEKTQGEITLLSVIHDPSSGSFLHTAAFGNLAAAAEEQRKERAEVLRKLARGGGWVKKTLVEFGEIHEIILSHQIQSDLIIMGTKGISGLSGVLVGSVALRVLRGAEIPVITVRDRVPEKLRKIVAATDTSLASGRAMDAALMLAEAVGAEVIPVYVDTLAQHGSEGKAFWAKVVERVSAVSQCKDCTVFPSESPVKGILEFAKAQGADMIAVGTRGLSGIRQVLGSTAIAVLSASSVPVMVV